MSSTIHSIHGLVSIRLDDAPREALHSVQRLFGASRGGPAVPDEPDVRVSFTERMPPRGPLRLLGLNQAAYDDDHFYVLDGAGRRTMLDLRQLGHPIDIVCERGVRSIPLLLPIVGLRLLEKRHVLLHSCAFRYRGRGTVVSGWQKGGKTETLLAFMAAGADYLSDEWSIISGDGSTVYGLASIVQTWSWHLRYLPELWPRLEPRERQRLRLLRLYQRLYRMAPPKADRDGPVATFLHRLSLEGGVSSIGQVRAPPERLFDGSVIADPAPVDFVLLATSTDGATDLSAISGQEVAERMAASLRWERRSLMAAYDEFRFAFPDRRSPRLESASEREHMLLRDALSGRPAYEISHPYPVALPELRRVAEPLYE
jgi:hypothetical protein